MPFKKRVKRSSRRYKRRYPRMSTMGAVKHIAGKAWQGVRMLKGLVNAEKKYFDAANAVTPDWNGNISNLNAIAAGNDVNQRSGNSILAKSLLVNARAHITPGAGAFNDMTVRMMLIQDTQNTGTNPTVADILAQVGTVNATNSPLNVDHTPRYIVLRDKRYVLDITKQLSFNDKEFVPLNFHIKYTGTNSTDLYSNALYIVWITSENGTTPPTVEYYARLGFYDN